MSVQLLSECALLFGASLSEPRIHEEQEAVLYVYMYVYIFLYVCLYASPLMSASETITLHTETS